MTSDKLTKSRLSEELEALRQAYADLHDAYMQQHQQHGADLARMLAHGLIGGDDD